MQENPSGTLSKEQFIADNMKQFGLSRECWEYFYNALDKVILIFFFFSSFFRHHLFGLTLGFKDASGNIDFKEWCDPLILPPCKKNIIIISYMCVIRLIGMYIHQKGSLDEKLDRMNLFEEVTVH
jgi:hypothetical protein